MIECHVLQCACNNRAHLPEGVHGLLRQASEVLGPRLQPGRTDCSAPGPGSGQNSGLSRISGNM